jgi:hypothetical protein
VSHHQPHHLKPKPEWFAAVLKDGARCHGSLMPTRLTRPEPTFRLPSILARASRAHKPIGPPDRFQIGSALLLRRKPIKEFLEIFRVEGWLGHCATTTSCGRWSQSARQVEQLPWIGVKLKHTRFQL